MSDSTKLTIKELARIKGDRAIRQVLTSNSHQWFFLIYVGHYVTYPFAPFHYEMLNVTEDKDLKLAVVIAFRGSGKTTLMALSYPIWSIIGSQKKKFVLIISQTQNQARLLLTNIKRELETNSLLKADIGPFEEFSDEWGANSIVLSRHDARITVASTEQGVRGIRHGAFRPDLVICDDVEDLNSVKTKEGRDKTYDWLNGEILPIGDKNTKFIIIGNLLHEDSLLMRLKKAIDDDRLNGKFFAYPLLDEDGKIAWPEKFKTRQDIENLRKSINESAWYREYLLKIISDDDRVVKREWIHCYDNLPNQSEKRPRLTASGVDLAISEKTYADFTAAVSAHIYGYGKDMKIYILPNPLNKRLPFPKALEEIKKISERIGQGIRTKIYVEDVGYQGAMVQQLVVDGYSAEGVKIFGQDKHTRLTLTTDLIQSGTIFFPRYGAKELIQQLVGFGIEKHDDLVDAFTILIIQIINSNRASSGGISGGGKPIFDPDVLGDYEPITFDMKF